jgi:hypothetical protein
MDPFLKGRVIRYAEILWNDMTDRFQSSDSLRYSQGFFRKPEKDLGQ